ncbi:MAG TPA: twin-arginine translocation signal domain-containing protein [Myxococcota bacterium]|nr:twin-arginine translocation signal domain-containing protein [Myxococcota bacterium]HRY92754.1 twin-arginine translocation signal domain-containing protein [Myxococcota bacterium]HSA21462.1 twin-arginine translocation signal domain-containing protein [Myxococcota bacterium]
MTDQGLDRRDFLKAVAATGAALAVGCQKPAAPAVTAPAAGPAVGEPAPPPPPDSRPERSRVVLVRDQAALGPDGQPDPAVLARMLDDGVVALLGAAAPAMAWGELFRPGEVVGIKSNVWRFIPVPAALEELLRARVQAAGVAAADVAIDDRGVLENPVFQRATALLDVRTLRTHHWSGIGSCLKNYIMFSPEPSSWHEDACADLGGLWELPIVRGKTRLCIQVALTPLFHGKGPHHYSAEYTWAYGGLILGRDPVAVDAVAVRLLEAKRRLHFGKDEPFAVSPKHVRVAQDKYRLGWADPERIELVKLGWSEGALI